MEIGLSLSLTSNKGVGGGTNIVFHGDSITDTPPPGVTLAQSYPQRFAVATAARQTGRYTVRQRGCSGSSWNFAGSTFSPGLSPNKLIDDALVYVDPYAGPNSQLVLFAGTNGIALAAHSAATEFADFETYLAARLAAGYVAGNISVVTMLPRDAITTARTDYNALLVAGAVTYGYKLVRLDLNTDIDGRAGFSDLNYYNADKVHPLASGHDQIAETVYDAVFGATWTPLTLHSAGRISLAEWFDMQDASSYTLATTKVATLTSKAPTGHVLAQATDASRPIYAATGINGYPAMDCTSGGRIFRNGTDYPDPTDFGFLVVEKQTTGSDYYVDLRNTTGGFASGAYVYHQVASTGVKAQGAAKTLTSAGTGHHILSGELSRTRVSGGTCCLREDGLSVGIADGNSGFTDSALTPAALYLGSSFGGGTIGEVVLTYGGWAACDRRRIEIYCRAKWGTP